MANGLREIVRFQPAGWRVLDGTRRQRSCVHRLRRYRERAARYPSPRSPLRQDQIHVGLFLHGERGWRRLGSREWHQSWISRGLSVALDILIPERAAQAAGATRDRWRLGRASFVCEVGTGALRPATSGTQLRAKLQTRRVSRPFDMLRAGVWKVSLYIKQLSTLKIKGNLVDELI